MANIPPTDETRVVPKKRSRLLLLIVAAPLLMTLAIPCTCLVPIGIDVYKAKRERQRLLHETDHHALLAACRKLMQEQAGQHIADPEHDPQVPPIIRDLGPSYMDISAQQVRVELHGGFDHYGFIAFAEGANGGDSGNKLIDGLYYYSE